MCCSPRSGEVPVVVDPSLSAKDLKDLVQLAALDHRVIEHVEDGLAQENRRAGPRRDLDALAAVVTLLAERLDSTHIWVLRW